MKFKPDYMNIVDAAFNRQPKRLPLYEHNIDAYFMERIIGKKFVEGFFGNDSDLDKFFKEYNQFFYDMGYDTVTFEAGVCTESVMPHCGSLGGHKEGYINSAERLKEYPFNEAAEKYMKTYDRYFNALKNNMPDGMKAIGGVGNGIFEIVQDITGYENLCIMKYEEPEMYTTLFSRVGDMYYEIWKNFLEKYNNIYCVLRFGDDLGFKSNTLLPAEDIKKLILPQYKRVIELVHSYNKPFLLHSCGNIFNIMDDIIACGINAKHSNEDQICDYFDWIDKYGDKIGNFGGIDTDHLVRMDNAQLEALVTRVYDYCHQGHGGIAIGSGNSIPSYVKEDKYLIMVNTVRKLRGDFSD